MAANIKYFPLPELLCCSSKRVYTVSMLLCARPTTLNLHHVAAQRCSLTPCQRRAARFPLPEREPQSVCGCAHRMLRICEQTSQNCCHQPCHPLCVYVSACIFTVLRHHRRCRRGCELPLPLVPQHTRKSFQMKSEKTTQTQTKK